MNRPTTRRPSRALALQSLWIWMIALPLLSPERAMGQTSLTLAMPDTSADYLGMFLERLSSPASSTSGKVQFSVDYYNPSYSHRILDSLVDGHIDAAAIYTGHLDILAINDPFIMKSPLHLSNAIKTYYGRWKPDPSVHYLSTLYLGSYDIMGSMPFHYPEDLSKKRIASNTNLTPYGIQWKSIQNDNVFNLLESGTIDGFEIEIPTPYLPNINKGTLTLTRHKLSGLSMFMNPNTFFSLPADIRTILEQHIQDTSMMWSGIIAKRETSMIKQLEEKGVEVVRADFESYRSFITQDPQTSAFLRQVSGDSNCPSEYQCVCKTSRYGVKGTCDDICYIRNDCDW